MILTVRELVDHLGMNPKTEVVGASIMVRVLERLGAIKKVGSRPILDENGKQTIGRPSALYEFPEVVSFKMPEDALVFAPKVKEKKAKTKKVAEPVQTAVDLVESDLEEVAVAPVEVEAEVEVAAENVIDLSADNDLHQLLRESA